MPLIIHDVTGKQLSFIYHFLQTYQCTCFMAADITKVIGTGATHTQGLGILIIRNVNFVKSGVVIILHTENCRTKKIVMLNQFYKTDRMNFFSPTDYFIT